MGDRHKEVSAEIKKINGEVRANESRARRAYDAAEREAGVGLDPADVAGVLAELMGEETPEADIQEASRKCAMDFPPGTTLGFETDFMELYQRVAEGERLRRKWLLIAAGMKTPQAAEERAAKVFAHFDVDGRGAMAVADVGAAMRAAEIYLGEEELDTLLGDVPGDEVDSKWFSESCARCLRRGDLAERRRTEVDHRALEMRCEVEAVFALWDLAGTGMVPFGDVFQGLGDCGWDPWQGPRDDGDLSTEELVDMVALGRVSKQQPMERS